MRNYFYIKHKVHGPIEIHFNGLKSAGFSIGAWNGYRNGLYNVTQFKDKKSACGALKLLRYMKSEKESLKFRLVRVTVK